VGVAIAPDRRARLQAGVRCTYMAFMRADCKWPIALLNAETQAATAANLYVYNFRPALIACVRGAWRVMRSRRVAAQMRGEFPQIDRICITIAGIGMAKFV
jgi:hypothetical protein